MLDEQEKQEILDELTNSFRVQMSDMEPELNILDGKELKYSDSKVEMFLKEGAKDLNRGTPRTNYIIYNFPDKDLLVKASMIVCLIAEGFLQLKNQIDYSDSGFTVAIFNKTAAYQGWAGFLLQTYIQDKKDFKNGITPNSFNSGFVGIISELGWGEF